MVPKKHYLKYELDISKDEMKEYSYFERIRLLQNYIYERWGENSFNINVIETEKGYKIIYEVVQK